MTLWTFDIEAEEWDKVRCVCFTSIDGDVERFAGAGALERAADFQADVKGTHVAHAGGIYDTLLISQVRQRPWEEVIMSGSAVLTARDGGLRVRDSFRWWLAGLRKVGVFLDAEDNRRRIGLETWKEIKRSKYGPGHRLDELKRRCAELGFDWHELLTTETAPEAPHADPGAWKKKDVDRQRISELSEKEALDYCEHDCRILLEGVQEAHRYLEDKNARKAWTAGSSALSLLQALEPASWGLMRAHALPFKTALEASVCVRGARNETWALGHVDGVRIIDVKSMYPSRYAYAPIPIGALRLESWGLGDLPEGSVVRARWFWPWRGGESELVPEARVPPVLDQLTGAGAGWCEAWIITDELERLRDFVSVQIIEGWKPVCMAPIGQIFARALYDEKERGSAWAKVFLNAFHGKCSEHPVRECWKSGAKPIDFYGPDPKLVDDTYWRYLDVAVDARGFCPPHLQPLAAAYILGRARVALWDAIAAILKAGGEVFYVDTDSIHYRMPDGRELPFRLGKKLGQWAREGGPYTMLYCGPKAYVAIHTSTSAELETKPDKPCKLGEPAKGALKGVPWNELKDGVREHVSLYGSLYRQARGKEKGQDHRIAVFDEALRELEGARIKKEGIATWAQGLKLKSGFAKYESIRTIVPRERGKTFDRHAGPTVWSYRSPHELLLGRGLDLSRERGITNPAIEEDDYDAPGELDSAMDLLSWEA